jgi:hypothetical protein
VRSRAPNEPLQQTAAAILVFGVHWLAARPPLLSVAARLQACHVRSGIFETGVRAHLVASRGSSLPAPAYVVSNVDCLL